MDNQVTFKLFIYSYMEAWLLSYLHNMFISVIRFFYAEYGKYFGLNLFVSFFKCVFNTQLMFCFILFVKAKLDVPLTLP